MKLFSDRQTGPWLVTPFELAIAPNIPGILDIQLEQPVGTNGDTLHLTVYAASTSKTGTAPIGLGSPLGGKTTVWCTAVFLDPEH